MRKTSYQDSCLLLLLFLLTKDTLAIFLTSNEEKDTTWETPGARLYLSRYIHPAPLRVFPSYLMMSARESVTPASLQIP